jgi:hypothetical protein
MRLEELIIGRSGKVDSARTWSEVAISISSSLPNGGKQKDQLYAQYQ